MSQLQPHEVIILSIILAIIASLGTILVAKITAKYGRASSREANEISLMTAENTIRNTNLAEFTKIIEELKDGARVQREETKAAREENKDTRHRLDIAERDIKEMKSRHARVLDYLRKVLAIISKHGLDAELPDRPDDIEIY